MPRFVAPLALSLVACVTAGPSLGDVEHYVEGSAQLQFIEPRKVDGRTNLPDGVELAAALRCIAPQGVAGCDCESPLEAMRQALLRTQDRSIWLCH